MMLDSHPAISCGPEYVLLSYLAPIERRGNWGTTLERYGYTRDQWREHVRGFFEALHLHYAAAQGKARWGDKSPNNTLFLDYIDALYPHSQIVHIVRHPRDVIDSNRRKFGTKNGVLSARKWVRYVRSAEAFGARHGPDRYHVVRYEDLVADPEGTLRGLIGWLGEPWDASVLRFGERTHFFPPRPKTEGERNPTVHQDSVGKGATLFTVGPLVFVRLRGGDLLGKFGYRGR